MPMTLFCVVLLVFYTPGLVHVQHKVRLEKGKNICQKAECWENFDSITGGVFKKASRFYNSVEFG